MGNKNLKKPVSRVRVEQPVDDDMPTRPISIASAEELEREDVQGNEDTIPRIMWHQMRIARNGSGH